nr:MAG TPA: hypothetical protein [Caudoviricetes sp.]
MTRHEQNGNGKALLRTEMQRLWMQGVALISKGIEPRRRATQWQRIETIG